MEEIFEGEIIIKGKSSYLHVNGFVYIRSSSGAGTKIYWRCRRKTTCGARATTVSVGETVSVLHGGNPEDHATHAPDPDEVLALKTIAGIKRAACDHPEAPPSRILRELQDAPSSILAQLPNRVNIVKSIQRERLKNMPSNPRVIEDLQKVPDKFQLTKTGEKFLVYDSFCDDDCGAGCGRILVFATRENLRLLFRSAIWFVDGTFKSAPSRHAKNQGNRTSNCFTFCLFLIRK